MGTFQIKCPSCNQTLRVNNVREGMKLRCPKCKSCFKIKNAQSSLGPDLEIVADAPRTTMGNEAKQNFFSSCQGEEVNQHLLEATIHGDFKTVQFLVEECHANINYRDQYGYTPLLWSCITGKVFFRNYIPSEDIVHQLERLNTTPETKLPIVAYLLDKKADIKVRTNVFTDEERFGNLQAGGASALHLATDSVITKLLITHGAEINAIDATGDTPLHIADEDKAKVLLENGANPKATGLQGRTPLHVPGSCKRIKLLISYGADVNARDSFGYTPLHFVNNAATAQLLVTNGANVNSRGLDGETPLHCIWGNAFRYEYADFVQITNILFNSGADMSAIDFFGRTIFHHFAYSLNSYPNNIEGTPWTKLDKQLSFWGIRSHEALSPVVRFSQCFFSWTNDYLLYNSMDNMGWSPADYENGYEKKFRLLFPGAIKMNAYSSFPLGTAGWVAASIYLYWTATETNSSGTLLGLIIQGSTFLSIIIFIYHLKRYLNSIISLYSIKEKINWLKQSK